METLTNDRMKTYVAPEKKQMTVTYVQHRFRLKIVQHVYFFFFINSGPNIKYTHNIIGPWVISRVMVKIIKALKV